jgi:hypothetical protein
MLIISTNILCSMTTVCIHTERYLVHHLFGDGSHSINSAHQTPVYELSLNCLALRDFEHHVSIISSSRLAVISVSITICPYFADPKQRADECDEKLVSALPQFLSSYSRNNAYGLIPFVLIPEVRQPHNYHAILVPSFVACITSQPSTNSTCFLTASSLVAPVLEDNVADSRTFSLDMSVDAPYPIST